MRLLAEECTSLNGTVEHIVGDLTFFNHSVEEQKQKITYIGKHLDRFAKTDFAFYYNIPHVVAKVSSCTDNFAEQRRAVYQNPAILRFSPVMRYMHDFHNICDRFLRRVQLHEDPRLTAGRHDLRKICRTFGD